MVHPVTAAWTAPGSGPYASASHSSSDVSLAVARYPSCRRSSATCAGLRGEAPAAPTTTAAPAVPERATRRLASSRSGPRQTPSPARARVYGQ